MMTNIKPTKQQLRRVLQLAEIILHTPPEKHDQGHFGAQSPACGMSACAGGWAAIHKLHGLRGKWDSDGGDGKSLNVGRIHNNSDVCDFNADRALSTVYSRAAVRYGLFGGAERSPVEWYGFAREFVASHDPKVLKKWDRASVRELVALDL